MLLIFPKQIINIVFPLFFHADLILFGKLFRRPHALLQRHRTVLQNLEQNISGIFQLREHHEIELFEIILLVGLLRKEAHRLLAGQNDSRRLRAGKGQGKLPQSLIFFRMSRVQTARIAKRIRAQCLVEVTEILIIQKSTAAVLLIETLLFPVDGIAQTFSKLALLLSVPLQRILVDHNLPAGAAGIRTISCCACKLIVKMWFQISHVFYFPSLYFCTIHAPASPTGIPLFSAMSAALSYSG